MSQKRNNAETVVQAITLKGQTPEGLFVTTVISLDMSYKTIRSGKVGIRDFSLLM